MSIRDINDKYAAEIRRVTRPRNLDKIPPVLNKYREPEKNPPTFRYCLAVVVLALCGFVLLYAAVLEVLP